MTQNQSPFFFFEGRGVVAGCIILYSTNYWLHLEELEKQGIAMLAQCLTLALKNLWVDSIVRLHEACIKMIVVTSSLEPILAFHK